MRPELGAPLASICIPNFNMARYLPAAIESALRKIIETSKASFRKTLERWLTRVIHRYAARHGRIHVFGQCTHVSMSQTGIVACVMRAATISALEGITSWSLLL